MENIVLGTSLNNRLTDDKIAKLLPALSLLAEDIGEKTSLDSNSFREILVSVGADQEAWAHEELKLWLNILDKAKQNSNNAQKDAAIAELKNRGIPDFPARLAVYVVTNQPAPEPPINKEPVTRRRNVGSPAGSNGREPTDKPVEPYHRLLPDHGWHNDITWQQLPDWIKRNPQLITSLKRGKPIIGRNVIYKFVANMLIRRLRYRVPVTGGYKGLR
jgi:hypothetical protein